MPQPDNPLTTEPYPKWVENKSGDRMLVHDGPEQDEWTKKGYLRRIARDREYFESLSAKTK